MKDVLENILTPMQLKAITLLLCGVSYREIARQCETTGATVCRWTRNEVFHNTLAREAEASQARAMGLMRDQLDAFAREAIVAKVDSIQALRNILKSPDTTAKAKMEASKLMLEICDRWQMKRSASA